MDNILIIQFKSTDELSTPDRSLFGHFNNDYYQDRTLIKSNRYSRNYLLERWSRTSLLSNFKLELTYD